MNEIEYRRYFRIFAAGYPSPLSWPLDDGVRKEEQVEGALDIIYYWNSLVTSLRPRKRHGILFIIADDSFEGTRRKSHEKGDFT